MNIEELTSIVFSIFIICFAKLFWLLRYPSEGEDIFPKPNWSCFHIEDIRTFPGFGVTYFVLGTDHIGALLGLSIAKCLATNPDVERSLGWPQITVTRL